ncbi:transmembrane protein 181 [Thecamonas trahens ATCC 50062]|uniref:Transmembrane protein 181 n=1 Tax=Thecamonas trahens ATCC 50062 TaxID=461836 RepID=A0A0L0D4N3_THETB|nr:transmembrane protein 181 [Thecamonas trahens ATCC 50062]KNC46263.1 transmembrane protein 181 [Thecamonas trahens ATCC 50062]|eukprot:XP_013760557.1 transmembrane protein 181 [Thecamonas trahens ATCC 50062]
MELESSMKMNLYDMSKATLVGLFTIFLCLFSISVIIGAAGPPIFDSYQTTALSQGVDMRYNTSQFNWEIQHLDKLNQMLIFKVALVNGRAAREGINTRLTMKTSLYGSKDGFAFNAIVVDKIESRKIKCSQGNIHCDEVALLHEPFVHYPIYRVDVRFLNAEEEDWIQDAVFIWRVFNHSFTLFELWFRFTFLVLTFVMLVWFSHRLRAYKSSEWSIEQKWMTALLFSLLAYNNPLFPLTILADSWFPEFLDVCFFVTFIALLLLFWLCILDSIRKPATARTYIGFYLPKVALVGTLWLISVVVFTWQELHELDNPTYSTANDIPGFIFFRVVQILLLIGYTFWLIFVAILGVKDRRAFPRLSVRIKYLGILTIFVLAITITGIVLGVVGTIHNNAAQFLSFFSLFNLYIFFLAIVYAPPKNAGGPAHMRLNNMAPVDSDSEEAVGLGAASGRRTHFRDSYTDDEERSGSALTDDDGVGGTPMNRGRISGSGYSSSDENTRAAAGAAVSATPAIAAPATAASPAPAAVFGAQPLAFDPPAKPAASTPTPNLI